MNHKQLLFFFLIFHGCILSAQTDSVSKYGTIKIGGTKAYVKASTDFSLFTGDDRHGTFYQGFATGATSQKKMPRFINIDARPRVVTDTTFDYTTYFKENKYTKDIRLHSDEADTVRIMIYVDKKGEVKYQDLITSEKRNGDLWVYDRTKKSYKIDVVHERTMAAFKGLIEENWIPAKVIYLKKHPSKKKKKYDSELAYSQGILTIIYSGFPLKEESKK